MNPSCRSAAVGESAEVVHSLAKWKRLALKNYHFYIGNGLYTDMNAIRRDEELDNIHSIYVDQWDWEKVISREDRTIDYLIDTVEKIVGVICDTNELLKVDFPELDAKITRKVKAITSEELLKMYPGMTAKERENVAAKEFGTVLLMKIGGALSDGKPH
ncbi:MAG: aspartate--ammonia ligase, partial [Bacteroidaceae bacterium]|nr:aspartate--ammonia ligase [Bacteroidaceae bacterium]